MSSPSRFPPWVLAPIVLVLDFVSKRLVLAHIDALAPRIDILGDLLRLAYVRNAGAAMGLALGGRPLLIGVSVAATVLLILLYRRTPPDRVWRRTAMAAIAGGALGNLVDRIFYDGLVVDFIDIGLGSHRFWTFNVADMGVSLGGLALFVSLWRESPEREPIDADPPPPAPEHGDE